MPINRPSILIKSGVLLLVLIVVGAALSCSHYSRDDSSYYLAVSQDANEFFSTRIPTRPTALFTIGLSGSGKSMWSKVALRYDWLQIDIDQYNVEELERMWASSQVADEIGKIPDPRDSELSFMLRGRGAKIAKEVMARAVANRRSFVFDALGLDETKKEVSNELKAKGYQIWWLIFHSNDIEKNRFNLILRERTGRVGSFVGHPIEQRCKYLNTMLSDQLEKLQMIEADLKRQKPREVDQIFTVEVADLRGHFQVKDPCASFP